MSFIFKAAWRFVSRIPAFKVFLKALLPKTLVARFMLIIIIPTVIGQSVAIHIFYERHWYNVLHRTSNLIIREVYELVTRQPYYILPNQNHNYLNLTYKYKKNYRIPDYPDNNIEALEIFRTILNQKLKYPNAVIINKNGLIKLFIQIDNDVLRIILPSKSLINPTTNIFVLWILSLTVLLLTVALIFLKNQLKSILELTKAAENYGHGKKIDYYKPSGAKEIRNAGLTFLKMKERIEKQVIRRTRMLAMISHDLRTPLTRIKLQIELMPPSEEKEELSYDIEIMIQMINSYLDFSRSEEGENFQHINLINWFKEYLQNEWHKEWQKENIELKLLTSDTASIPAAIKPHSFRRAITNLISNGVKYANKIIISLQLADNIIIIIEDDGKGIADKEKKHVFKPFYREDKSRSLDNFANVGLGLAITKEIITSHHGTITLEDSKILKGLLVRITLPAAKELQ